ncbi:alpha-L-rhamnosidase [Paenibacillus oceani]|uniref:alpha-L-rhamnosidase n=1 Tax=Paenibacillus oceani TaxID=2772510 RepID=A0A927GZI3_9BACL|nr:alpha-L-rhamnosidase [Paenibacillus oceani]MBD2862670.1 family 78 glycoside hydrolase catalytic domain [Paenibacillus oceani]
MESLAVVQLKTEYKQNPLGLGTPIPRLSWKIRSERRNVAQQAYRIQVAEEDSTFSAPLWDSGKTLSDRSIHVEYGGPALKSRTRYYYRVRVWDRADIPSDWSDVAYWETGLLDTSEWSASWISPPLLREEALPADYLRTTFIPKGRPVRATVYATALGLYELHLNGKRVGDSLFSPGWTSYRSRLQVQAYDVTDLLEEQTNALGIVLGDGWYKGNIGWLGGRQYQRNYYGNRRAALAQLHLKYEDGSEQMVTTDSSWSCSTGPIVQSEIYHGETYDARLEQAGWSTANFKVDGRWRMCECIAHGKNMLVAQESEPVRIVQNIHPIAVFHTPKGETVLDMGQNMVGWVRMTVRGEAGHQIILRHAEILDKDGNLYTDNLRTAKQTNVYICKGGGEPETYEPHFTFQGFRYVQIDNYPGEPATEHFLGRVIHSDMEQTGRFECSEPLVDKLQRNIIWGQRGNFLDVPTDCPQRDERLGWTGDAQVFIRTASFNMNVASFFGKWLNDVAADQFPDGGVPAVIPDVLTKAPRSSAAWGDAATVCPWTVYLCYGDKRILERQYESMKAWVEYIRVQGDNELLWNTGAHFGDWLGMDAKEGSYIGATASDLIATAFYAYSVRLVAKAAAVLGREADSLRYAEQHRCIVAEFRNEFVSPNGRICSPTQTAHALALAFGLVEGETRRRVADALNRMVADNGYKLTTGFVGTPYLCIALSQNGHHETAARLVLQQEYPSWLYSVLQGATTIWEHWDGIRPDGALWSPEMNSYNHYAYGAIGEWLYRMLAGIDTDDVEAGFKRIRIHPRPAEGFRYARATYESMYGEIGCGWERNEDGYMRIDVVIPPNTTAEVFLPGASLRLLEADGRPFTNTETVGLEPAEQEQDGVRLTLGSGRYRFAYGPA